MSWNPPKTQIIQLYEDGFMSCGPFLAFFYEFFMSQIARDLPPHFNAYARVVLFFFMSCAGKLYERNPGQPKPLTIICDGRI